MIQAKRKIKFLERKEIDKIISSIKPDSVKNLRDRALLTTLFSTGLRISEALALVETPFMTKIKGTHEMDIVGKGGWQRVVYFSPDAIKAIKKYLELKDHNKELLFPITARCVQKMVIERAKDAGITKRVTPHVFRHSLATDLLRKGVDIRFVSEFLGHRSINNTMIYTHVVNEQLKSIHSKIFS